MPLSKTANYYVRFCLAVLLTGIGAGFAGLFLSFLLHFMQHIGFGYSTDQLVSSESFLQGVRASNPIRRAIALVVCGLIVGIGWWALYRYGKKLVTINNAAKANPPYMPPLTTFSHSALQIITVGLGSPLGREGAPREAGATIGGWISKKFGLELADAQVILACGAGAGLAAVYNVPFAGALFTLEVLLVSFRWSAAVPEIFTSTLAAVITWIGFGDKHQYQVAEMVLSYSLVIWSILIGPFLGVAAYYFVKVTSAVKAKSPKNWKLIPYALANFTFIGFLAIPFPELLGNGKGPLQLGFDGLLSIQLVAMLLVIKFGIILTTLRVGAEGGLLTPGLMQGALLAILLGSVWNMLFPVVPMGAFAIVGATAFLAASMKMPITAIVLVVELTHTNQDSLIPMLFAVVGSVTMYNLLDKLTTNNR